MSRSRRDVFRSADGLVVPDLAVDLPASILLAQHPLGMGIQILNPIHVTARGMDAAWLKRTYRHRLAFCGGVDQREVLPHGTPGEVEEELRQRIMELGPGGGYVLAPTQDIQSDTPMENVLAVFEAAKWWGRYPLRTV